MTSEIARDILNGYINEYVILHNFFQLPEHDAIVYQYQDNNVISQYTFKHLLKISYNLQDK